MIALVRPVLGAALALLLFAGSARAEWVDWVIDSDLAAMRSEPPGSDWDGTFTHREK